MSAFYDALEAAMKAGADVICRRLFDFDFAGVQSDGQPNRVRLWEGNGKLYAGGEEWKGFYIGDQAFLDVPELPDGRDGEAPVLTFRLGFLPQATYQALRADRDKVENRPLTIWRCYIARGEGLRAVTPPGHPIRLTMLSAGFENDAELTVDGMTRRYVASVTAKGGDAGRSYAPNDTLTDVNQRMRAKALAGVEDDAYARFVPLQQNRLLTIT